MDTARIACPRMLGWRSRTCRSCVMLPRGVEGARARLRASRAMERRSSFSPRCGRHGYEPRGSRTRPSAGQPPVAENARANGR